MKLLANENFPLTSVQFLRSKGHDVLFVGEDFPGISDEEVLEVALKEKRTILTFDRDYGELIFKYQKRLPKGVLYLRLETFDPMEPGLLVEPFPKRS